MIVGFILKNRGSLNQTLIPPNTMISTAVTTCIRDRCPVSHQSIPIASRKTGMNPAVTTIKPSYSVPPKVKTRSLSIRYAAKNAMIGPSSRPVFTNGLIFCSLISASPVTVQSVSAHPLRSRAETRASIWRCAGLSPITAPGAINGLGAWHCATGMGAGRSPRRGSAALKPDQGRCEILRVERRQIVDLLAHADRMDRQAKLVGQRHQNPALRRAVELGHHQPRHIGQFLERLDLAQGVLPRGGIEHQKRIMRRAGIFLADDPDDLGQFFH